MCAFCGFPYSSHWQLCRRSLSPGHPRCGGQITEPKLSLWLQDMLSTGNGCLVPEGMTEATQGANPPLMNDSGLSNQSVRTNSNFLSDDTVLKAIRSLSKFFCYHQQEFITFQALMNEIMTLPIATICHIPRSVRPLFAEVLAKELRHATYDSVWVLARLLLLPKAVLRCPSRGGKKNCFHAFRNSKQGILLVSGKMLELMTSTITRNSSISQSLEQMPSELCGWLEKVGRAMS